MGRFVFFVVMVMALAAPASTVAQTEEAGPTPLQRVSAIVQPSIVYLDIQFSSRVWDRINGQYMNNGEPFTAGGTCSGFFVSPDGNVVTAGHCVAFDEGTRQALYAQAARWAVQTGYYSARPSYEQLLGLLDRLYSLRGERESTYRVSWGVATSGVGQAQTRPGRLLGYRAFNRGDVALLKIEAEGVPALRLNTRSEVTVGQDIVAIGFPAAVDLVTDADKFDPSFKDGTVSSLKTVGGGLVQVYEVSAAVSPGMSGGPTVNLSGDVIGVNSFRIRSDIESQAFNFASPAKLVTELLVDKGIKNQIGAANQFYRQGLQAFWERDRNEAIENFDQALQLSPSFASAQDYRRRAAGLPEVEEGRDWTLWIIIAAVAAAVLVGLVSLLSLSRRRARPAPVQPAWAGPPVATAPAPPPRPAPSLSPSPPPAAPTPRPDPRAETTAQTVTPAPSRAAGTVLSGAPQLPVISRVGENGVAADGVPVNRELLIGRENADILVDDPEVSRRHATVRPVDGTVEITDLRSANGTQVNGKRIETDTPTRLASGDTIVVGKTTLKID